MSAIEEIFDIELEKKQQIFEQTQGEGGSGQQMTIGEQCKVIRDMMIRQK